MEVITKDNAFQCQWMTQTNERNSNKFINNCHKEWVIIKCFRKDKSIYYKEIVDFIVKKERHFLQFYCKMAHFIQVNGIKV